MKYWEVRFWRNNRWDHVPFGYHRGDEQNVSRIGLGPIVIGWEVTE